MTRIIITFTKSLTQPHTSVVCTRTPWKVCLEFTFSAFSFIQMFKFVYSALQEVILFCNLILFFFQAKIYNWADRWCISLHSSEYVTVAGDSLLIGTKTGQLLMCSVKESSSFNNRFDGKPAELKSFDKIYTLCNLSNILLNSEAMHLFLLFCCNVLISLKFFLTVVLMYWHSGIGIVD